MNPAFQWNRSYRTKVAIERRSLYDPKKNNMICKQLQHGKLFNNYIRVDIKHENFPLLPPPISESQRTFLIFYEALCRCLVEVEKNYLDKMTISTKKVFDLSPIDLSPITPPPETFQVLLLWICRPTHKYGRES